MENKRLDNALRFYILATKLKYKIRSGWNKDNWNIDNDRIESIAEHVYGTCILAISLDSEFDFDIDLDKVLKMLVLHEIGEVIIGDITPFDNITLEEKQEQEHKAMAEVLGDLVKKEELLALLYEFDERKTKEAIFAYHCDKLEADLQSKVYQDMGCHHSLDEQQNNKTFQNKKVKEMVKNGAKTPFDIWYLWDKDKYKDDEHFTKLLKYIKDNDTNKY